MPQTIKAENYVNIQGWMITELGLKNSELLIYALIWGFSQDKRSAFVGNLAYLQEWTQASKQTVITALKSLVDRGLIVRCDVVVGGTKAIGYYAARREVKAPGEAEPDPSGDDGQKIRPDGQKIRPTGSKNLTEEVKKFDSDNNNINKYNNHNNTLSVGEADGERADGGNVTDLADIKSPRDAELAREFESIWCVYPRREGKADARKAYIAARKAGTSRETIAEGVNSFVRKVARQGLAARYTIQGGKWFAGHRWEDDPEAPAGGGTDRDKPPNRALDYKQKQYTAEELKALGVDLGEDIYGEQANRQGTTP